MRPEIIHTFFYGVLAIGLIAAEAGFGQTSSEEVTIQLTSPAFQNGRLIPDQHTCKGTDLSPEILWSGAPYDTKSFALIMDDPDAPGGTYTHWIAYNIPGDRTRLPPGLPAGNNVEGIMQGQNDSGTAGYGGPCPPAGGGPHRYFFKLYALDASLELLPGSGKVALESAMNNHIIHQAELMGQYEVK